MTKQITIAEFLERNKDIMDDGWVACSANWCSGSWVWFKKKPKLNRFAGHWDDDNWDNIVLSRTFNIAPAKSWTKSLIKVGSK